MKGLFFILFYFIYIYFFASMRYIPIGRCCQVSAYQMAFLGICLLQFLLNFMYHSEKRRNTCGNPHIDFFTNSQEMFLVTKAVYNLRRC